MAADDRKPWLEAIKVKLEEDRDAIEFEIGGPFTWREHAPWEELVIIPAEEGAPALRAYLANTGEEEGPRLVIDDYWPTLDERTS